MADTPQNTGHHTHAPYNFVPFSNKRILPAADLEELTEAAGHDQIRPDRLTGELHVTLTAETPVFVSDGNPKEEAGGKKVFHFFRDARRRICIPGSTVRGILRQNMKILGFGLIRLGEDVEDQRLYFREIAAGGKSVRAELKKDYNNVLGVKSHTAPKSGKTYSIPENVRSGWLEKRDGEYRIYPTAEPYYRISRKREDVRRLHKVGERELYTKNIPVAYQPIDRERVGEILPLSEKRPGMKEGSLLCTGRWVSSEPNHLYLFPQEVREGKPIRVEEADRVAYQEDFENRENTLKQSTQKDSYDPDFWRLPKEGERKPVFYLRHEGHLYFGMSLFLRIGFRASTAQGLPPKQREAAESAALDYTDTLLGFVRDKTAYASRVSVGDFPAEGQPAELPPVSMILGNPKPSYYPGYLVNTQGEPQDGKNYNNLENGQPDFLLRGYKHYWLKPVEKTDSGGKDKVGTAFRPLPAGTAFHGVIRFENLTEEELGLLIWCLRLKRDSGEAETYYQSVGMGKPYGYGRMVCTVDRVLIFDFNNIYHPEGLFHSPRELDSGTIDGYVAQYDRRAAERLPKQKKAKKATLLDYREIQTFLYMKHTVQPGGEKFSYMELSKYQNVRTSLPTADELRKEAEAQAKSALPDDDSADMDALLRKLNEKGKVQDAKRK